MSSTELRSGMIALMFWLSSLGLAQADIVAGLIGHWKLDETVDGPVVDSTGTWPDGSNMGATVNQPGKVDQAYLFVQAEDDKVNLNAITLVPANDDFSAFMWINTTAHGVDEPYGYVFNNYVLGATGRSLLCIRNEKLEISIDGEKANAVESVNDGVWHHLGVTRDSGEISLWVDASPTDIGTLPDIDITHDWYIGNRASGARGYDGLIDDLRVYNRALSAGDVAELAGGSARIPGDANEDGKVTDADAAILASHWQQTGAVWADGDFNADGKVTDADAAILASHWQYGVTEGAAAVPEPGCVVLLLGGLVSLFVWRRRSR